MKRIVVVVTKVVFAASMSACDGDPSGGNHGATAGAGRHAVDSTTADAIRGYVVLDGEAPANPLLRMGTDPECLRAASGPQHAEDYVLSQQPVRGMKATHVFTQEEFATTWRDGRFELRNVPPGTYTIGAWHERLGVQTQVVTVGRRETRTP